VGFFGKILLEKEDLGLGIVQFRACLPERLL
jgi:hypothetical protein